MDFALINFRLMCSGLENISDVYTFIPEDSRSSLPVLIHISAYGGGAMFRESDLFNAGKYYGFAVFR